MSRNLVAGVALLSLAAGSAWAKCAPRDALTERLSTKFDESLTARGLQNLSQGAALIEIWSSPDTGTFTVLMTSASGQSCIVAAGSHFFAEDQKKLAQAPKGTPG
jgi:hypothetical protein